LIFQLIHPTLADEKNVNVLKDYSNLLRIICCLISRKCFIYRTKEFILFELNIISYENELGNNEKLFINDTLDSYFQLICTCCDKQIIDTCIKPSLKKEKNQECIEMLQNRPKFVDSNILIQFFHVLNGDLNQINLTNLNNSLITSIKTRLLYYIERAFNHLEFPRLLNENVMNGSLIVNCTSTQSSNSNINNLTFLYKEALNLFSNESLNSLVRAYFARFTVPKLVHLQSTSNNNSNNTQVEVNLQNSTLEVKYDHNFNLENQLCDGFLKSKMEQNFLNNYLFIISLGRLALSLKCDDYLFVTVRDLIEIFDSNDLLASSLAQQQLLILSKHINMQELMSEFNEKVCEIISDTIYNSTNQQQQAQNQHSITMDDDKIDYDKSLNEITTTSIVLNDDDLKYVNYSLKDLLRVFNITDSCYFIRNYQKYLLPNLICKANNDKSNYKLINKSIEFLARKLNITNRKIIEENFPYVFVYSSLNGKDLGNVFSYCASEANLEIDKQLLLNRQRLFNELLSRCGNIKHKQKVWHAILIISFSDNDDNSSATLDDLDEHVIAKLIEPNFLAALIHFDMCLMRSSINVKEKCRVLESLNVLISMLGVEVITKVRYKIMTTLKLAMQQCSKFSELNCKLWDTFIRNVDKQALGPILNQISVNLLQLLDLQPFKVGKIFEYLIVNNSDHLASYFNELYFIPDNVALQEINKILYKHTNINYILDKKPMDKKTVVSKSTKTSLVETLGQASTTQASTTDAQLKALITIIKHYLKGALHENADLRVKALQQLYALFKEKSSQIIYLIQRQENSDVISEIILALLNGCRDTDVRAKLLFGCCLGEIGALDPANILTSLETTGDNGNGKDGKKQGQLSSNELLMNPSLVGEDSSEFSECFSYSLIIELSKAYLAARNTHEQDSASYGIQEALKIYGCSAVDQNSIGKMENKKLWNSFPDYIKEILTPLRTSKYEIHSFENFSTLKTPIILCENECKTYEDWIYKWCAYLISKLKNQQQYELNDKELQIFPKLAFIIRFNVNVALFILPYIIIKIIMLNFTKTIDQIYEEIISVIKLNELTIDTIANTPSKMVAYKHICCQTIFNIYDHLMRQLNYYRTKLHEAQAATKSKSKGMVSTSSTRNALTSANETLVTKYNDLFELFNKFITRIPQQILSNASLDCKAYCRALMHYEIHMRNGTCGFNGTTISIQQVHLNELQNIYASMDEIDAAFGILFLCKGSEESLYDIAFRHKINGKINESIACLEKVLETSKNTKNDFKQHETFIRTFISVGRHRNALSYLEGLMNDKSEWKEVLNSYRIEACWKLGSWDKLKQICVNDDDSKLSVSESISVSQFINSPANDSVNLFNAGIGKLFCSVECLNEVEFYNTLSILREQQIVPLSAVSMESGGGSYQRGYEYVINLQILKEIENCLSDILRLKSDSEKEQFRSLLDKKLDNLVIEPWERRVETMQPSFKYLEPIYNVRISLLNFLTKQLNIDLRQPITKLWLRLAKIARKAGMFENAYQYMLNGQSQIDPSDTNNLEELLIEKSKWYWQHEDRDSALFYLNKGLNELFNCNMNDENYEAHSNNELYSKVLLMYTKFSEENGSLDSETIRKNYLKVQKMCSKVEQSHFQLAQFLDRLGMSVSDHSGKKEKFWEYISEIVNNYATSLEYGCQFIYQSLPRMITLWLDFGAEYFDMQCSNGSNTSITSSALSTASSRSATVSRNVSQLNVILTKLNQVLSNALQRLPTYTFLTVYSQLVSRICHPEERVFETLSNIIMKVLFVYPSQAIWMLIAVKNSSVELRRIRCKIIVDKAIKQRPDLKKFINDSSELAEKLVQLGNLNVETGVTQLSLSSCFKPLKRLVESKDFSRILIPSQFQCTLQLPSMPTTNTTNTNTTASTAQPQQVYRSHNPYPLELVYIHCFEDSVSVMNSLQKPKKVTIRGTDGKLYSFLCKAKDDLRIDYRIMEFFSVVNKCLKREPEARRRNLYIRTYAVTPLNEFCGIIEWIENLATLRSILVKLYSERNVGSVTSSEWRMHEDKISKDKDYGLKVFRGFVTRFRPTVLYEWFLRVFPEPNTWYNARSSYVRTAAVMSICGYVLGLGDRHCENILMASSNGDCIHVDFNCLFNKGETLGVPEIVPFRLTHNMIDAMGPLGYEGMYRKVCEVSLRVIREYRESLITILKTFIYDPLVEWKAPTNAKSNESGETISAKVIYKFYFG
jgi:serine/threonine-protein kinase ATR